RAWRNSSRRGPLRVSFLLIGSTRSRGCAAPSPNPNELTSRDGERFPGVRIALLALESQRDRASLGARRQRLRVERPGAHPCPTDTEPDFPTRSFARSSLTHVRTPGRAPHIESSLSRGGPRGIVARFARGFPGPQAAAPRALR